MTTAQIEKNLTENIQRWIKARGTTRKHVYVTAGMSRQSFERSMDGARPLNIREMGLIAEALGVDLEELLSPADQVSMKQAA